MSTTTEDCETPEGCRPAEVTPVTVEAEALESTAPEYLRDFKRELATAGYQPASVSVSAAFDADCSFETQAEVDRLRAVVRAAAFLGAGRVAVVAGVDAPAEKVDPALSALRERADREGIALDIVRT
jgi:sugar phosphate isomerase/epimerase